MDVLDVMTIVKNIKLYEGPFDFIPYVSPIFQKNEDLEKH